MKTPHVWPALLASAAIALPASGSAAEILVGEGETREIAPQIHRVELLEIRKGGTLVITDTTEILADRLVTQEGAKILYQSPDYNDNVLLNLVVLRDASGLTELDIVGEGKNSTLSHPAGQAAGRGGNGRGARCDIFNDRSASPGGGGGKGDAGGEGEDALDVSLYLPKVVPNARVRVSTVGGNGGRGQDAGDGGKGGGGCFYHACRSGGPGGNGGGGGKGGDAGRVVAFLVVGNTSSSSAQQLKNGFKLSGNVARGRAGAGGAKGEGGPRGNDGGSPCSGQRGDDGSPGAPGGEGDGPMAGELARDWMLVELFSDADYRIYLDARYREELKPSAVTPASLLKKAISSQ